MPKGESMLGKSLPDDAMDIAGQFTRLHQLPRSFKRLRIGVRHGLRARTDLASNQRTRKLHPVSARARNLERIQQQVVSRGYAMTWNLERRLRFAVGTRKKNI